jgi:hypothetical protein
MHDTYQERAKIMNKINTRALATLWDRSLLIIFAASFLGWK